MQRATAESRRREHRLVTNAHLFLACAQSEWDLFARVMNDVAVNPEEVVRVTVEHLRQIPSLGRTDVRVSPATHLTYELAMQRATRANRTRVEAVDLLAAVFEEKQGVPASILRQYGAEPARFVSRLDAHVADLEARNERLRERFELPPRLLQAGANLNLLAWQESCRCTRSRPRDSKRPRDSEPPRPVQFRDVDW